MFKSNFLQLWINFRQTLLSLLFFVVYYLQNIAYATEKVQVKPVIG